MQKITDIKSAWLRKYPEQVVLCITRSKSDQINVMAIGWVAIVSDDPVMYMIGIDDNAYTLELIREQKEFVLAFPAKNMSKETLFFGTVHGHDRNKGVESGLEFVPASQVNAPLLSDAVVNLECKLVTEYRPGNCPLVIGEVIAAHENCDPAVTRLINAAAGYKLQ